MRNMRSGLRSEIIVNTLILLVFFLGNPFLESYDASRPAKGAPPANAGFPEKVTADHKVDVHIVRIGLIHWRQLPIGPNKEFVTLPAHSQVQRPVLCVNRDLDWPRRPPAGRSARRAPGRAGPAGRPQRFTDDCSYCSTNLTVILAGSCIWTQLLIFAEMARERQATFLSFFFRYSFQIKRLDT